MHRRDALIALGHAALGALAAASPGRARALPVPVGRWTSIPHGLDPAHAEPMELGASRAARTIVAIPERAPSVSWEREAVAQAERRGSRSRPPIVAADGTIYVGTPGGLTAFSATGGVLFEAEVGPLDASPVLVPGGAIVTVSRAGRVSLVSREGSTLAQVELGSGVSSAPLALDDGSVVIAGTDRTLRRLDASLRERWRIDLPSASPRAPTRDGDRMVVVASSALHVIDFDGAIERSVQLTTRAVSAAARADDGTLWITTADGHLVAISARRREGVRIALGPTQLDDESPAVALDGSVRIAARAALRCIGASGEERWAASTGASIDFPVRVDGDGKTLLVDRTPELCAIDGDGGVMWRLRLSAHVMAAPVVMPDGGIVMVGAQGRVIVVR